MISYAQNFEDVILWRALKNIDKGFYIDIGANDPDNDSVTRFFYENLWSGINIEPDKEWFKVIEKVRGRDVNFNIALGEKEDELTFYTIPNTGLSTLDENIAKRHQEERGYEIVMQSVQMKRFADIYPYDSNKNVHFMKIDVEGAEKRVLEGVNFSKCRPWIVLIESTLPNQKVEVYLEWEHFLLNNDYKFVYFDGLNRFYVASEKKELFKYFVYPPCVFDDFYLSGCGSSSIQQQQAKVNIEVISLEKRLDNLKDKSEEVNKSAALFKNEIRTLTALLDEATLENTTLTNQLDKATVENATLTNQLDKATLENTTLTNQLDKATVENTTLTNQLDEATLENTTLTNQLDKASLENTTLTNQLDEATVENTTLTNQLDKATVENTTLTNQLDEATLENTTLTNQLDKASNENKKNIQDLNAQKMNLKCMNESLSWKITYPLRFILNCILVFVQLITNFSKKAIESIAIFFIPKILKNKSLAFKLNNRLLKRPSIQRKLVNLAKNNQIYPYSSDTGSSKNTDISAGNDDKRILDIEMTIPVHEFKFFITGKNSNHNCNRRSPLEFHISNLNESITRYPKASDSAMLFSTPADCNSNNAYFNYAQCSPLEKNFTFEWNSR